MNTTHAQVGADFIRSGFGLFIFGLVMSFGIIGHYIVGARYPTGEVFLSRLKARRPRWNLR
jgi:hypothetical protein